MTAPDLTTHAPVAEHETTPVRLVDVLVPTVAAVPITLVLAVLLKGAADTMLPTAASDELRSGAVDFLGASKAGEWAFTFSFWPLLVGLAIALYRRYQRREPSTSARHTHLVLVVPAAVALVPILLGESQARVYSLVDNPMLLAAWFQLPVLVFWATHRPGQGRRSASSVADMRPLLWLAMSIAPATLGAVVALQHLTAPAGLGTGPSVISGVLIVLVLALGLGRGGRSGLPLPGLLRWGYAFAAVATLPLLLPPLLHGADGYEGVPGTEPRVWTMALVVVAVAILLETGLRGLFTRASGALYQGVSSIGLAVLLVSLRVSYHLPAVPSDDYHFGELIVPGAAWFDFGQMPFVDISLPRGILMNVVPGLANSLLNDGTAAPLSYTRPVIALAVAAVALMFLRRAIGLPAAAGIVALLALSNSYVEGDLLIVAIIVWCLHLILHGRRPFAVGVVLAGLIGFAVLAYSMMGVIVLGVIGGVLVAGLAGALLSRDRAELRRPSLIIGGAVFCGAALVLSPLGPLLRDGLSYVLSNAGSNTHAFGLPLDSSWRSVAMGVGQLVHTAFALGVLASIVLLWSRRATLRTPSWSSYALLAVAAVPGVVAVVLFARFMGRIDAEAWPGRSIMGTLFVVGAVLPGVLLLLSPGRLRRVAWAGVAVAGTLALVALPVAQGGHVRNALGWIDRPETWVSEGAAGVVPRLGVGNGDVDHLTLMTQIGWAEADLPNGEPVLNVANRGALFTYFGWRDPIKHLAPYNIESAATEAEAVDALVADPPQYVFLGPGPVLDWSTLTLRNPSLSRWLVDNYTPISCGPTTWATWGVGAHWSGVGDLICATGPEQDVSRAAVTSRWAATIGAGVDLDMLPATWAQGEPDLGTVRDLDVREEGTVEGQTLVTLWPRDAAGTALSGDLLVLDVACGGDGGARPEYAAGDSLVTARAYLNWSVDDGQEAAGQSAFRWGSGPFVIPLDAYPTWSRRADRSASILLTMPTAGCTTAWSVEARLADR